MLSVRINTCRSSSCGRKSLELRTLLPAPSGLCANGSEVLTTALKSACPRILLTGLQSMRQSWPRHVTSPSPGEHPAEETLAARPQSFDAAAGDHDAQTARSPHRPSDSRFQPKAQGRQTGGRARISTAFSRSTLPDTLDWLGARMLLRIFTHSLKNSKWRSSLSIWLAGVSCDWANISQSSK